MFVSFFLVLSLLLGVSSFIFDRSKENPNQYIIENDFIHILYDSQYHTMTELSADFLGTSSYGTNLLMKPFQMEINLPNNVSHRYQRSHQTVSHWKESYVNFISVLSTLSIDSTETVSEQWVISLNNVTRTVDIAIKGKVLSAINVNNILYSVYVNNPSIYGLFEHGSFQMMNKENIACLGSNDTLDRAYFMGNGGALDVSFLDEELLSEVSENVFLSSTSSSVPYKAGIQHVIAGHYPNINKAFELAWNQHCWESSSTSPVETVSLTEGQTWNFKVSLLPNNYDFPAYLLNELTQTSTNMNFLDLRSTLTAVYGSPTGCIQSYYDAHDGMIAPTIAHPIIGYYPKTNFFDPDNFISLSALIYSNDPYLLNETKKILKKTAETMCGIGKLQNPLFCNSKFIEKRNHVGIYETVPVGSTAHFGQIMHHFNKLTPDYKSIAGSIQLGPNIFWTLCTLRYISVAQDNAFATEMLPYIELSTSFLLTLFDPTVSLIDSPGPLWIDVFVRENYTSDSNAMLVPYLQEVASFYDYMSYKPDSAAYFRDIAVNITSAINTYLWNKEENDHYITQLNKDLTTTRDFVDYDSNFIALAFGIVPSTEQAKRIFQRIDSNPVSHARATWVSEKEYTGNPSDCYSGPVANGLCGDSNMTMGRIGWVDSLARKRYNDEKTYTSLLLSPLQNDLITNVWLTERYDQYGNAIRTPYYFEYAALVPIMLREVSYGIEIKLNEVIINPLVYKEGFDYSLVL
jgi:hypothetical protein